MTKKWALACGCAAAAMALAWAAPSAAQLDRALKESENATSEQRASQQRVDELQEAAGDLFREYRATLQRIDSQKLFVAQQEVFLRSQAAEIDDLKRQIEEVDDVTKSLIPMQREMIDRLEEFISLDLPFKLDERQARVKRLRELIDRPDVDWSEKYRKIIEAYEIEAQYGRGMRHFEGKVNPDEPDGKTVDFLLIGRVAYIYAAQDESEMGIWESASKSWKRLPDSYRLNIRGAIRIAKEVTTPDVIIAPVPGPTVAEQGRGE